VGEGAAGGEGVGATGGGGSSIVSPIGGVIPGGAAWARVGSASTAATTATTRIIGPDRYKPRAARKCAPTDGAVTDF
jgi:hypothetical protein